MANTLAEPPTESPASPMSSRAGTPSSDVLPVRSASWLGDHTDGYLPLSLGQYHWMIETGLLPESLDYELRRGVIVPKDRRDVEEPGMHIGVNHSTASNLWNLLVAKLDLASYFITTQTPLTLPHDGEPEPDGMILRGGVDQWRVVTEKPLPSDVLCVYEVASSSLPTDRGPKREDYAIAQVPMYVIANLVDQQLEVHTVPDDSRFAEVRTLRAGDTLTIPLDNDDTLSVPVADLLPQPSSR
ncbi:MAG: Uma2 family endonuclease [Planctomycetota bacterium]